MHAIRADRALGGLTLASKFNTEWSFLTDLRDQGRSEAKKWLKSSLKDVGERSSVDIVRDYLGKE
jgi:NTE family protein